MKFGSNHWPRIKRERVTNRPRVLAYCGETARLEKKRGIFEGGSTNSGPQTRIDSKHGGGKEGLGQRGWDWEDKKRASRQRAEKSTTTRPLEEGRGEKAPASSSRHKVKNSM